MNIMNTQRSYVPKSLSPQHRDILNHLKQYPHLTTLEATFVKRIGRVATRVFELKAMGYPIITEMALDNDGRRYARYRFTDAYRSTLIGKPRF